MIEIHQMVPSLTNGDALGDETLEICKILNLWGYKSYIYTNQMSSKCKDFARDYREYSDISSKDNILIFHFSIGSDMSEFVRNLPDKKIIIYHNITPPEFFVGYNDVFVDLATRGRKELAQFAGIADLALGVSEYNRKELESLGFERTGVLPFIVDLDKYSQEPDKKIMREFTDDYINFLFVGRIVPNKRQEDVIRIFYYFNKYINSKSRLFLVGTYMNMNKYYVRLNELIERLKLKNVYITGHVDFKELLAYYRLADIFISMSEHEGFCVPLIESMYFNIPIVAYNSTAIPIILHDAGILVNKKAYEDIAELVNILICDKTLRAKIIKNQQSRLKYFNKSETEEMLKKYISMIL